MRFRTEIFHPFDAITLATGHSPALDRLVEGPSPRVAADVYRWRAWLTRVSHQV
jgi:hypothetical protein